MVRHQAKRIATRPKSSASLDVRLGLAPAPARLTHLIFTFPFVKLPQECADNRERFLYFEAFGETYYPRGLQLLSGVHLIARRKRSKCSPHSRVTFYRVHFPYAPSTVSRSWLAAGTACTKTYNVTGLLRSNYLLVTTSHTLTDQPVVDTANNATLRDPRIWEQPNFQEPLRVRLHKCLLLLGRVLRKDDPNAVHDLRVWSRRLQQAIVVCAPFSPEARMMVKELRRVRRLVGPWRDCDVLIDMLQQKARRISNPEERQAWDKVRAFALRKRKRQMDRARRKLAKCTLSNRAQSAPMLFQQRAEQQDRPDIETRSTFLASVVKEYEQWRAGLSCASASLVPTDIHKFRIHTKRLRYRIELAAELGAGESSAAISSLKMLQDELGLWRDQTELARLSGEALADADFLVEHPRPVSAILRKLDRDRTLRNERIRSLLSSTLPEVGQLALHLLVTQFRTGGEQPSGMLAQHNLEPVS